MSEHLADAANTLYPCVLALRAEGFAVTRTDSELGERWHTSRGDLVVSADDPLQLLGLARMRDLRGADWRVADEELEALLAEYVPVRARTAHVTPRDAD